MKLNLFNTLFTIDAVTLALLPKANGLKYITFTEKINVYQSYVCP